MRLDDYLNQHRISQAEFASRLPTPVTQGLVSQWVTGNTRITLNAAIEIRTVTHGAVSVDDCAAMYGAKEAA